MLTMRDDLCRMGRTVGIRVPPVPVSTEVAVSTLPVPDSTPAKPLDSHLHLVALCRQLMQARAEVRRLEAEVRAAVAVVEATA